MQHASCRFVQIADIHYATPPHPRLDWPALKQRLPEQVRAVPLADTMLPMALEQIQTQIKPDFIVYTGDQVDSGWEDAGLANLEAFREFTAAPAAASTPIYSVYGNHDGPRERFTGVYGETTYSFAANGCHFAVLDSGLMTDEQEDWDQEAARRGNELLGELLTVAGDAPVAVLIHFYIYPAGVPGYSFRGSAEAIELLERHSRPVPVINGHHHSGRVSVVHGVPYYTARSFTEAPWAFCLHELSDTGLIITEFTLDTSADELRDGGQWRGSEVCRFEF